MDNDVRLPFHTYFDQLNKKNKRKTRNSFNIAFIGIILFILITFMFPFRKQLLTMLFPKATTQAVDVTSQIQVLGNPLNGTTIPGYSQPIYARNPWDLQKDGTRIYIGHGNAANSGPGGMTNTGPLQPIYYETDAGASGGIGFKQDPIVSGNAVPNASEEQINSFRILDTGLGNQLHFTSFDPQLDSGEMRFYRKEADGWYQVDSTGIGNGNPRHTFDMLPFGSEIFVSGAGANAGGRFVGRFTPPINGSTTWTPSSGSSITRGLQLFSIGSTLYLSVDESGTGFPTNGRNINRWDPSFRSPLAPELTGRFTTLPQQGFDDMAFFRASSPSLNPAVPVEAQYIDPIQIVPCNNGCNQINYRVVRPTTFTVGGTTYTVYIGARNVADLQWVPFDGALYKASSAVTYQNRAEVISGGGLPNTMTSNRFSSSMNWKPWDILVDGSEIFVLGSEPSGSDQKITVYKSTDLITWTEVMNFTYPTFARSFEKIGNDFYFGMGTHWETATTRGFLANGTNLGYTYTETLADAESKAETGTIIKVTDPATLITLTPAASPTPTATASAALYCAETDTCNPPLSRWSFDEGNGTSVADSIGGITGTFVGSPSWQAGKAGQAVSFNGTNSYIDFGVASSLLVNRNFSIEGWIYQSDVSGNGSVISHGNNNWLLRSVAGKLQLLDSNQAPILTSNTTRNTNTWYHFGLTIDNATPAANVTFYLNGTSDGTATTTAVLNDGVAEARATIGGDWTSGAVGDFFTGIVDEMRIYNYVRTSDQINYSATNPVGATTVTPTVTVTATPVATPSATLAPTATPTNTPIPTNTPTPTMTIAPTATPTATLVPTATPSGTPTLTPIPTATPVPCSIIDAKWGSPSATLGQQLSLNVTTAGNCSGKQVNFTVRRNIGLAPDEDAVVQPQAVAINQTTVTGSWVAEWKNACFVGTCDPEYFFKVNVVGDATEVESTNPRLIQITSPVVQELRATDMNADDTINGIDATLVMGAWKQASGSADINKDGRVNGLDFAYVHTYFGKNTDGSTAPTPTTVPVTPTPTPIACSITSATWEYPLVMEKQFASMTVKATGDCAGQSINFVVRENRTLAPDVAAQNQPNPAQIPLVPSGSEYVSSVNWFADECTSTGTCDKKYFFKANIVGNGTTMDSSSPRDIIVAKSDTADAYPLYSLVKEQIPAFCTTSYLGGTPIITSRQSGNWTDPNTWNGGVVPTNNAAVNIQDLHTITFNGLPADNITTDCIRISDGGELKFKTDQDTKLTVGTMVIYGGLEVGTAVTPIQAGKKAEIVIADKPLDINFSNPAASKDPNQFGTGILGLKNARIRIHGEGKINNPDLYSPNTYAFIRLATEPKAGDTTLQLAENVLSYNWKVGDKIVLPDSRQAPADIWVMRTSPSYIIRNEEVTIAAISADGRTLTLASPLASDHPGARDADGTLRFLPHVGNMTRNVVVRSANPSGTRGHGLFSERADVDIRYAQLDDMGRTKASERLDNVVYDASNNPTKIGTNQIGRYTIHLHHNQGPMRNTAQQIDENVYQGVLVGNAIDENNGSKWGVTLHNTHYTMVKNNVIVGARGSAIMLESGNEYKNVFEGNFLVGSQGPDNQAPLGDLGDTKAREDNGNEVGWEGTGIWSASPYSYFRNNVAASNRQAGILIYQPYTETTFNWNATLPVKNYVFNTITLSGAGFYPQNPNAGTGSGTDNRGADIYDPAQTSNAIGSINRQKVFEIYNNETYGTSERGIHIWGNSYGTTIDTARIWHTHSEGVMVTYTTDDQTASEVAGQRIKNTIIRGDVNALSDPFVNNASAWNRPDRGPFGIRTEQFQYSNNIVIENSDIQGMKTGLLAPCIYLRMNNNYLRNYQNVHIYESQCRFQRQLYFDNNDFYSIPNVTLAAAPQRDFYVAPKQTEFVDNRLPWNAVMRPEIIRVFGYKSNGLSYGDFRLYFLEQDANFNIKNANGYTQTLSYWPSMTNQQSWTTYGDAIGGAIAPCNTQLPKIRGFTCSLDTTYKTYGNPDGPNPFPSPLVMIDVYGLSSGMSTSNITTQSSVTEVWHVNDGNFWGYKFSKQWNNLQMGANFVTITDQDIPAADRLTVLDINKNGVIDPNEQFKKTSLIIRQ